MTPCAGATCCGNDRLREVEGMAPALNRIGTCAALRIAEQDLADTGKARLHKTRDIVGDVMGEPDRKREFRLFRSQRGDTRGETGPVTGRRLVARRPDLPARRSLLELDRAARFEVEDRSGRESQRRVRVEREAQPIPVARGFDEKGRQLGTERCRPVGLVANEPLRTLDGAKPIYTYDKDEPGKSNCVDRCLAAWPAVTAPAGAKPVGKWSIVARADGTAQWAYDGKPLYTFVRDAGSTATGDGIGGVWHLMSTMPAK